MGCRCELHEKEGTHTLRRQPFGLCASCSAFVRPNVKMQSDGHAHRCGVRRIIHNEFISMENGLCVSVVHQMTGKRIGSDGPVSSLFTMGERGKKSCCMIVRD